MAYTLSSLKILSVKKGKKKATKKLKLPKKVAGVKVTKPGKPGPTV